MLESLPETCVAYLFLYIIVSQVADGDQWFWPLTTSQNVEDLFYKIRLLTSSHDY